MAETRNTESTVLKIVGGAQMGAEVSLDPGEYTLGVGSDDDIQIIDVSMTETHARLRLAPGKIEVRSGSGPVLLGGLRIGEGEWQEIQPLDVITAGTTKVALGPPTAQWGTIAEQGEFIAPSAAAKQSADSVSRWRSLTAPLALACVVALGAGVYFGTRQGAMIGSAHAVRDDVSALRSALDALPFGHGIKVRRDVDGAIYVTGFVESQVERRAVSKAIDDVGIPVNLRLGVLSVFRSELDELIKAEHVKVTYDLSKDGDVALRGLILDPAAADRFVSRVSSNVIGVRSIKSEIRTSRSLFAQIRDLAHLSGIDDAVVLQLENDSIVANGAITTSKIDQWVGFLQAYSKRFSDDIELRSYVQLQNETVASIVSFPSSPLTPVLIGASPSEQGIGLDPRRLKSGDFNVAETFAGPAKPGSPPGGARTSARPPAGPAAPAPAPAASQTSAEPARYAAGPIAALSHDAPPSWSAAPPRAGAQGRPANETASRSTRGGGPAAASTGEGAGGRTIIGRADRERPSGDAPPAQTGRDPARGLTDPSAGGPSAGLGGRAQGVQVALAPGSDGRPGFDGTPGSDGRPGPNGRPGSDGIPSLAGRPGSDGRSGFDGRPGSRGRPGSNGTPSLAGTTGSAGKPGSAGRPGSDGKPGFDPRVGSDSRPATGPGRGSDQRPGHDAGPRSSAGGLSADPAAPVRPAAAFPPNGTSRGTGSHDRSQSELFANNGPGAAARSGTERQDAGAPDASSRGAKNVSGVGPADGESAAEAADPAVQSAKRDARSGTERQDAGEPDARAPARAGEADERDFSAPDASSRGAKNVSRVGPGGRESAAEAADPGAQSAKRESRVTGALVGSDQSIGRPVGEAPSVPGVEDPSGEPGSAQASPRPGAVVASNSAGVEGRGRQALPADERQATPDTPVDGPSDSRGRASDPSGKAEGSPPHGVASAGASPPRDAPASEKNRRTDRRSRNREGRTIRSAARNATGKPETPSANVRGVAESKSASAHPVGAPSSGSASSEASPSEADVATPSQSAEMAALPVERAALPATFRHDVGDMTVRAGALISRWLKGDLSTDSEQEAALRLALDTLANQSLGLAAIPASLSEGSKELFAHKYLPLFALSRQSNFDAARQCRVGSRLSLDDLPAALFWLDLMSTTNAIALRDLGMDAEGFVLEAALNPNLVRTCIARDPAARDLAKSSIYLQEAARNPEFVRFVTQGLDAFPLDVTGASLDQSRFVQLRDGEKMHEGEAPDAASRIDTIGELGVSVLLSSGFSAVIYRPDINWIATP